VTDTLKVHWHQYRVD